MGFEPTISAGERPQNLPNVIRVIKLISVRWAGNVARMEGRESHAGFVYVRNSQGNRPLDRYCRRGADSIKTDLKWSGRLWSGLLWFRMLSSGRIL